MNIKKAYKDLINGIDNAILKTMLLSLLKYNLISLRYLATCLSCLSYRLNYTEQNVKIFDKVIEILYENGILPFSYYIKDASEYDDINSDYVGFRDILFAIRHFYNKKRNVQVSNGMIYLPISSEILQ